MSKRFLKQGVRALVVILLAGQATAQPPPRPRPGQPPRPTPSAPAETKPQTPAQEGEAPAEPEKEVYFAVKGGIVHTVSDGDHPGATILCKNGKIQAIGTGLEIPRDAGVLDATGYHVYPGLVAFRATGFHGGSDPSDGTDVYSLNMVLALAAGITTCMSGDTVTKLTFGSVEDMIVRKEPLVNLNYSTRNPDARRRLRESLDKLVDHLRKVEAYEREAATNKNAVKPDDKWIRGEAEKHLKLLKGELAAEISADRAHDLYQACELANKYGIRIVVRGAYEGWTMAPQIARAGLSAVVTPRTRVDQDDRFVRLNGSSIENAAILHNFGVRTAILPPGLSVSTWGVVGEDLTHFNMEAAFAVRGGLPQEAAIRGITIDSARLLGVDHRVGSISVGKDADFCITDGDLLHYMTLVRWTVVNARVAYDKQKDTLFDHIRPGGDRNAPPPSDWWPRRLGSDWEGPPAPAREGS
jgi:imidazolonepropionase-like amidohydrolase